MRQLLLTVAAGFPGTLNACVLTCVGMDATADFEDVGHSDEARKMMTDSKSGITIKGDIDVSRTLPADAVLESS